MFASQWPRVAGAAAVVTAVGLLAGCGSSDNGAITDGQSTAGYRVLTGGVSLPLIGTVQSGSAQWPAVPSAAGKWWGTGSQTATFPQTAKVELLASGTAGVRFHLQWTETCGGTSIGKRGVEGGSGGEGSLTLSTPALVLVKLPAASGTYDSCYLATVASMHTRSWRAAIATAPSIRIVHY